MLSKPVGNVTFHFEPLIGYAIIIAIIFAIHIIRAIVLECKNKRISKAVMLGKYDDIIKDGEKLLKSYKKNNARFSTQVIVAKIEYLNFALAVSYFSKSNNEQFLEHINALSQYQDIKEFWLALFYLQQNDLEVARTHYNSIDCCEKTQLNRIFLESVLMHKQGEYETAKEKVKDIYTELKHPVLKQIADEMLS